MLKVCWVIARALERGDLGRQDRTIDHESPGLIRAFDADRRIEGVVERTLLDIGQHQNKPRRILAAVAEAGARTCSAAVS